MHLTRRWLTAPVLALAVLAAACSGGSSSEGGAAEDLPPCPVDALDAATGPVDVVLWYQLSGNAADVLEKMVGEYNASQSKVRVRAEIQGTSYDELLRKYEQGIPSGQIPNLIVAEDSAAGFLVDSGTVVPAQGCFEAAGLDTSGFVQAAVDHYTIDGTLWPATVGLSDLLTYYNKNHFRRADLDPEKAPATLEEVRSYAEKIKAAGVVDTPVVLKMDSWFLETQLTGAKQPMVDNDNGAGDGQTTEATFDTDTTRTVVEWIAGMVRDGLMTPVPATDGTLDDYLAMASQKASMTIETSVAATTIEDFLGGDASVAGGAASGTDVSGLDIGAAPVFGVDGPGKAQIGGNATYITTAGDDAQKAAAWDFMRWWNEQPQQVQWHVEGSYQPFLAAAADDPAVTTFWETSLAGRFLKIAHDELVDGIDPTFTGPTIGPYDKVRAILRDALADVAIQGTDPSAAIATAVEQVDAALTQYNDTNF